MHEKQKAVFFFLFFFSTISALLGFRAPLLLKDELLTQVLVTVYLQPYFLKPLTHLSLHPFLKLKGWFMGYT